MSSKHPSTQYHKNNILINVFLYIIFFEGSVFQMLPHKSMEINQYLSILS